MTTYKDTLNLPHTAFPMKANLSQTEPRILQKWAQMQLYIKLRAAKKGKEKFILHDGPPYANAHIHLGTAVNKILKDIVVKAKSLDGFDAPFVPGWDCHGLPIELNVEKKLGKPGHKVTPTVFREACREYAHSQVDIQREEFKRLGVLADWDHPYLTMNFHYEANIIRSLAAIIKNGHLQKGYKPVYWCLDCCSALAEAEVEYADKESISIDVRFMVVDETAFLHVFSEVAKGQGPISVPIWTTTPWTLPANQAVALNPTLNYVLIDSNHHERLLIAENLLSAVMTRYNVSEYRILGRVRGQALAGIQLKHPFYPRNVPIVLGEHVTVATGTGAVHTAPAHGQDDYLMGLQNRLPLESPIGDDGCFTSETPFFAGIHVNKANQEVLTVLEKHGMLLQQSNIHHSYPHCWRHKTPLILRATPQWFIGMQRGLREMAMNAINQVEWIPSWGKARIAAMIEHRPDWCISRQRTWGVPLALFLHKKTGDLHPDTLNLMEKVAQAVEKQGVEAWFSLDIHAFLGEDAAHYQKAQDTLDVWFDSGVSHACVLKENAELAFPADMVLEGSDQHRGWFNSLLFTSLAINQVAPYRAVLTHGFMIDGQGRKMSKSLGNVVAPEEVIKTLGADVLRLWVASVDYRNDISVSNEILTRTSETYRRIRNTARFMLANLHDFDPANDMLEIKQLLKLDRWIMDRASRLQDEIIFAYQTCQFHQVVQKLHHFCMTDLGSFYLDIIKDRQYTMSKNSRGRRSAQTVLFHVMHALVRWMAPILSFTAEEIWQAIPGREQESVMLTGWYPDLVDLPEQEMMNAAYWEKIRAVREVVNKEIENQRNLGSIGAALEAEVLLKCSSPLREQLQALGDELRFVLITSAAKVLLEEEDLIDPIATEIPDLLIKIQSLEYIKCERCWHRRKDVDQSPNYPGVCERCVENMIGPGEERKYA